MTALENLNYMQDTLPFQSNGSTPSHSSPNCTNKAIPPTKELKEPITTPTHSGLLSSRTPDIWGKAVRDQQRKECLQFLELSRWHKAQERSELKSTLSHRVKFVRKLREEAAMLQIAKVRGFKLPTTEQSELLNANSVSKTTLSSAFTDTREEPARVEGIIKAAKEMVVFFPQIVPASGGATLGYPINQNNKVRLGLFHIDCVACTSYNYNLTHTHTHFFFFFLKGRERIVKDCESRWRHTVGSSCGREICLAAPRESCDICWIKFRSFVADSCA